MEDLFGIPFIAVEAIAVVIFVVIILLIIFAVRKRKQMNQLKESQKDFYKSVE